MLFHRLLVLPSAGLDGNISTTPTGNSSILGEVLLPSSGLHSLSRYYTPFLVSLESKLKGGEIVRRDTV